jgi:hypothetical protein
VGALSSIAGSVAKMCRKLFLESGSSVREVDAADGVLGSMLSSVASGEAGTQ